MITEAQLDLANAEALDILDPDESWEVARLRASNDTTTVRDFEEAVRQTRETLSVLALATFGPPPARLRERVLRQIEAEPNYLADTDPATGRHRADGVSPPISLADRRSRAKRWQVAAASIAAAVALLVGGAFAGYQLRDTGTSTTQQASATDQILNSPDVRTVSVDAATGGRMTALYSKQSDSAVLLLNSLPKPSAEKVYQMWFITGSNAPVSAGVLTAAQLADKPTVVLNDVRNVSTLAFSVEPPGGSPQPTTTPFAAIELS